MNWGHVFAEVYNTWFGYNIEYGAFKNIKWIVNISILLARVTSRQTIISFQVNGLVFMDFSTWKKKF